MPLNTINGPGIIDMSFGSRSTNASTSSTTYADTGVSATVRARPGDFLQINAAFLWNTEAVQARMTAHTVVGGSVVTDIGPAGGTGFDAWLGGSVAINPGGPPVYYVLTAADIDGGRATIRLSIKCDSAVSKSLIGNATHTMWVQVVNRGAATWNGVGFWSIPGGYFAQTQITGGITGSLTSTSYLNGTPTISLPAREGDLLMIGGNWLWYIEATTGYCDVVTVISGSAVNYVSGMGASGFGHYAWNGPPSQWGSSGHPTPYVVQSNDIAGGLVTLRLIAKVSGTKNFIGTYPLFNALNTGTRIASG